MFEMQPRPAGYRPDIDGLRAIAVLSVLAFHLGVSRIASGGFVGVDIFFVISGYLITGIIDREIRDGTFSIANFYRRRALRILPAFFLMVIGVASASFFILPPIDLVAVGKSIAAAALSVSNVFFYLAPFGDFVDNMNARPMVHTWSLGVEEQFYLFFPLLLSSAYKLGRETVTMLLAAIGVASFAISIWLLSRDFGAAYYLLPSRIWELMLGGLAALGAFSLPRSRVAKEGGGALGLAMMLFAIVSIRSDQDFPFYWSLLPCLGSILVILSSEETSSGVGKLLSFRPLVWIGLISYSLYLWHWPVIEFATLGLGIPLSRFIRWLITIICFVLALGSWWFVERPFRGLLKRSEKTVVLLPALGAICTMVALGLTYVAADGFQSRFGPEANLVSSYLNVKAIGNVRAGRCFISRPSETFDWPLCLGKETGEPRAILFGDSHAADLWPGLAAASHSLSLRQVTVSSCVPLLASYSDGRHFCANIIGAFFQQYLKRSHPNDTIVMSLRWQADRLDNLRATIKAFRSVGARVVIVGPRPEYTFALPRLEFSSIAWNAPQVLIKGRIPLGTMDEALHRMASREQVEYVSLMKALCTQAKCRTYAGSHAPLMADTDNFTREGSQLVAPLLIAAITEPEERRAIVPASHKQQAQPPLGAPVLQ